MFELRDRLAVVAGLWAATTFAPPVALALTGPFDGTLVPAHGGVVAGLFLVGGLVARIAIGRMDDPATRLRDGLEMAGLMTVSGVVALAAFPALAVVDVASAAALGAGGALGFLAAFHVGYVADRAVIARTRAASETRLAWSATKRPASRRRRAIAAAGVVAAGVWTALVLRDGSVYSAFVPMLLGLSQLRPLAQGHWRRRYEITDGGLVNWVGHLPWENFDGFAVTEDALILYGNVWPFGTVAFDRESVEDLDAVVEALEANLSRGGDEHQDPSVLDNVREAFGS